jgi:hypothetical protein
MQFATFNYDLNNCKWSVDTFPALDSVTTLIIVFASPGVAEQQGLLTTLAMEYPKSTMVGCSTAGEIYQDQVSDNSLSVAILKFEKTTFEVCKVDNSKLENSYESGIKIMDQLNKPDLKGVFILSEGINVNGTELLKAMNSKRAENVVITGGLAGDGKNFKKTWSIYNGKVFANVIIAVGFYGENIKIAHASRGGWDVFGVERKVTSSKGSILYELDGQPALKLYKEYLGVRAEELPASGLLFPLAIRDPSGNKNELVRTILAIDEKEQSLTFAGDIPEGFYARLMRANFDKIIDSAGEAGEHALDMLNGNSRTTNPVLAISISCVGRKLLLGERIDEEVSSLLNALPNGSRQVGFYSYGEISPYTTGKCDLHNQTMTLTIINEI